MNGDEFQGVGGSYVVRDGKRVRLDEDQKHHPDGDRARDADGNAHDPLADNAPALIASVDEAAAANIGTTRRRGRDAE